MSQQHGVSSSLAFIEAAPPIHGTQTTSTISHSHPSTSSSSSSTPPTTASSQPGNISSRVHIPKLSEATTQLLARLAGNIKGTREQELRHDSTTIGRGPFPLSSNSIDQSTKSRRAGTMRVSSTFIELPTAPFVYPTRLEAPTVNPSSSLARSWAPNNVNRTSVELNGLTSIAPRPATYPTSASETGDPQISARAELPLDQTASSIGTNRASVRPVNIPFESTTAYSTSTFVRGSLQGPVDRQPTPVHQSSSLNSTNETHWTPHGLINLAPKPTSTSSVVPVGPHEPSNTHLPASLPSVPGDTNAISVVPHNSVSVAPKPTITTSTSVLGPGQQSLNHVQLPPGQPLPPPIAPLSRAPTILKYRSSTKPSGAIPGKILSTSQQRRSLGNRKSGLKKRKRGYNSDGEDIIRAVDSSSDDSDVTPTSTQTTSGRQVKRPSLYVPSPLSPALSKEGGNVVGTAERPHETAKPRKRVPRKVKNTNITCTYCQRGHSISTNTIVFCDGCNRAWHQYCHDPPIDNEVITIKEKEWLCKECKPVETTVLHPTVLRSDPRLTTKPPVHAPLTIPKAEVGAERYPLHYRRAFLSRFSHAALVELLLTVSDKHPTVPMYPENMASLPLSNFVPTQALLAANTAIPTPTASTPTDQILSNPVNSATTSKTGIGQPTPDHPSARNDLQDESSDDDSEYEFQEHRLYPRAGNGVRLPNNEEDLDILQDDPACATFSYALHRSVPGIAGNVHV